MWHASAAPTGQRLAASTLERGAFAALDGVGDEAAGQWEEWTGPANGSAYHLRRRLSESEAASVGPVVDVRGTSEARQRLYPVRHLLPPGWTE